MKSRLFSDVAPGLSPAYADLKVGATVAHADLSSYWELSDTTPSPGAARHPLPQGGEGRKSKLTLPSPPPSTKLYPRPLRGEGRNCFFNPRPLGERVDRNRRFHQPGRAG